MANTSNTPGVSSSSSSSSSSSGNNNNSNNNDSKENRWYFTAEQLANSPSRRQGIDADQELSFRQLTAYLIQEMGQRLQVSQLCINTAIVYMHRFYAFHSFTHFHRNGIAAAALFLAAKVEEQPRKLEHVIKVAHMCLNQETPHPSSDLYAEQAQDLVFNENVLLQTLGFDVAIDHPHTHVVKTCHLVKACKDLAQTSYFLASNSLHLTPMCLQYRPTVVACFCIYLACKWSRWEIPQSTEGRHWFHYVDKTVTMDLLKQLTDEFIAIYEKSPARLKSKLNSIKALAQGARIPDPSRGLSDSSNGSSSQPINQVEPTRRPDSHSSHHRSHHPSSSHSSVPPHHHHSKPVNEAGDHKSSLSHKQSYPTTAGHSNRPRIERSQIVNDPQYGNLSHSGGGNKSQLPLTSSSRSLSSSSSSSSSTSNRPQHSIPPLVGATSSSSGQRISSHSSQGHDPNVYHKSSRNSMLPPLQMNPPPPPLLGHKVLPKIQDSTRPIIKDPSSNRSIDPSKLSTKHPNNNAYASQSSNNVGIDMTRNVLQSQASSLQSQQQQQQRPYLPQTTNQAANYSQLALNSRTSSGSGKYDQQQSVQPPVTAHLQSNQKQSSTESSFGITNVKSVMDDNSIKSGDQMEICSPPKSTYSQQNLSLSQQQQQQYQQTSQQQSVASVSHQKSLSSIFSPEWNDRASQQPNNNLVNLSNNNINKLGYNVKSNRDSPKKSSDRDKKPEISKKDKIRLPDVTQQIQVPSSKYSQQQQQLEKRNEIKTEKDILSQSSLLSNYPSSNFGSFDVKNQQQQQQTHALNFSGVKRRASRDNIKFNEDIKDTKKIKVESQSPPNSKPTALIDQKPLLPPPPPSSQMFYNTYDQLSSSNSIDSKQVIKTFPTTVNGIETNPDLVSSLLKESLCREQKFTTPLIKKDPTDIISEHVVIDHTQSLMMMDTTLPEQILQTDVPIEQQRTEEIKQQPITLSASSAAVAPTTEEISKSKSEKKKKKEKHKHKEKDKSKDKEERKKHKKDKDRHKDKERQSETSNTTAVEQNPVKIKISKEKFNLPTVIENTTPTNPSSSSTGFKIKIPKDRIKGELSNFQIEDISTTKNLHHHHHHHHHQSTSSSSSSSSTTSAPSSLKIKISKDKIEPFNHQQQQHDSIYMSSSHHHSGNHGSNNSSSTNNNKKKDRDRDRDKDKKKTNSDYGKQNGSGGNKEINTSNLVTAGSNLSLKNQQTNIKMQQYNGNNVSMSQLFGESYDDDDDDEIYDNNRY